jgi:hypothetical protein
MASHASLRAKLKRLNRQLSGVLGGGGGAAASTGALPIVERGGAEGSPAPGVAAPGLAAAGSAAAGSAAAGSAAPGYSCRALEQYLDFVSRSSKERCTIKVDVRPDVTAELARALLADVAHFCGYQAVESVCDNVLLVSRVSNNAALCGSRRDTAYDFCVVQELSVREYGQGSTSYACLSLSWLDALPSKASAAEAPASASSACAAWPADGAAGSGLLRGLRRGGSASRSRKAVLEGFAEQVVGRWRAMLYQKEYALEAAALDNCADSPWQSLSADEVDYDEEEEEEQERERGQEHEHEQEQEQEQEQAKRASGPSLSPRAAEERERGDSYSYTEWPAAGARGGALLARPPALSIPGAEPAAARDAAPRRAQSLQSGLARPKSALKLPSLGSSRSQDKPLKRLQFSANEVQVLPLDISLESREARMGVGCSATDQFGEQRPLVNTRTGCLVFFEAATPPASTPLDQLLRASGKRGSFKAPRAPEPHADETSTRPPLSQRPHGPPRLQRQTTPDPFHTMVA